MRGQQVLGHLEQLLHWPAYRRVRDTPNVMLAADDDTAYQLVVRAHTMQVRHLCIAAAV